MTDYVNRIRVRYKEAGRPAPPRRICTSAQSRTDCCRYRVNRGDDRREYGTASVGTAVGIADRSDELAGRRILRRMSVFIAVGYAAYAAESIAPIFEASSVMATWWTATAAVLIFGTGLAMAPMAWRADLTRLRVAAFAAAAGYAIALGLWWFGWNGERLDAIGGIWFSNFPAWQPRRWPWRAARGSPSAICFSWSPVP